MGPTIESRFTSGAPDMTTGTSGANLGGGGLAQPGVGSSSRNRWLIITAISSALLLVVVAILLVMLLGREEKVCTYEDVVETVEKETSPSENWRIYEDFMFDVQEEALRVYAEAMTNGKLAEEGVETIRSWSEKYAGKFGGEAIDETTEIVGVETFMFLDEDETVWRMIAGTSEGCVRFDFSTDFMFLEKYSLTAGNCDEFRE
ncbi:hypothetical protein IJH23_01965 [Candidatus Saccharibacteria bacterium]|nr:hypothetical protein [Candidatus Saccharibacteria bacterium]